MKPLLLSMCLLHLLSGCATVQKQRCSALQEELASAGTPCQRCVQRLSPGGDAKLCEYVCAHSGQVAPAAIAACSPTGAPPMPSVPVAQELPPEMQGQ